MGGKDELVRGEAAQGLEPPAVVVGLDEELQVAPELVVAAVMVALDGGVLDRAVHPLDLTIGPRVPRLGQAVLDVEIGAGGLERVAAKEHLLGPHRLDVLGRPAVTGGIGEVRTIVGEHRVDPVGDGGGESPEEVAGDPAGGLLMQLDEGELARSVDGDEQIEPALLGMHLGDVEVEIADRVGLEARALGLVALDVRQASDAMALEAAVQA
jgi:hypothetical protein